MVFLDMLQIKYPVRCSKRYNNTFFKISIIINILQEIFVVKEHNHQLVVTKH